MWRAVLFVLAGIAAAGPWSRPDAALLAGIVLGLSGLTAFAAQGKKVSRWLIQACVVMLGLRLDLRDLGRSAAEGLGLALGTIAGALVLGWLLGKLLRTGKEISTLVSSGTAICGGSAIAAVGAAIGASAGTMAVATGAIFVLNAIGLWAFPPIGHALHLTDVEFGQWAGVALHDIASVGGAARAYNPASSVALDTANVVKLTRVVWIFPLAVGASRLFRRDGTGKGGAPFPWFVVGFVVASAVRTVLPQVQEAESAIKAVAGVGFQAALFLIGAGLTQATLAKVGWRALAQAAVLWVALAGGTLAWIVSRR